MHWVAPSAKDSAKDTLEQRLWDAADQFRANSGLKAQEYSSPILGLTIIIIRACRPEHYPVVACVSSDAFVAKASATANGAKMPRANWNVLEQFQVVVPNGKEAERFTTLFDAVIAEQQGLFFQIQNLRRIRDLLLPRLLSGQVQLATN